MTGAAVEDYADDDVASSSADLVIRTKAKARETITVTLDGHPLVIHQPKSAVLGNLLRRGSASHAEADPEDAATAQDDLIDLLFDPKAAKHLRKRLADADDEFDTEDLGNIFTMLIERWSPRPTGSPSGSRKSKKPTGRRSMARSR